VFDKTVHKFPDTYFVDLAKLLRVKVGSNPQNYLIYTTEFLKVRASTLDHVVAPTITSAKKTYGEERER
jgi:hypothetical protein